ncbi:hypothetical protein ACW6QP_04245 [Salegentibacter sp. HM20]
MNNNSKNFIWLGIIAFILVMGYQSYVKRNPVEKAVDSEPEFVDNVEEILLDLPESEYKGNSLTNGASPFGILYGPGKHSPTDHTLTIRNQGSSDVVVFLKQIDNDHIIRNHYVNANSVYTFKNIPNATCYVKFYYGNDWNPNLKTKNQVTGGFESDIQFVESPEDLMTFEVTEDEHYIYSAQYEITLETLEIEGQALQEKSVSAAEFF